MGQSESSTKLRGTLELCGELSEGRVEVRFVVRNTLGRAVTVYQRYTPFLSEAEVFHVLDGAGEEVKWFGPHIRLMPEDPRDWKYLPAGGTLEVQNNVARDRKLKVNELYTINPMRHITVKSGLMNTEEIVDIECEPLTFTIPDPDDTK
eukprot:TRINITY_DN79_c0_g1_i2.p1 TRINITY_DN79_c0_g1~~TRINITY_DN79_c0_g1_i2.p1  ORF type:complete len:149 (-),score=43.01 TRINITY_DN79_c0_g1_i2:74-520(-)